MLREVEPQLERALTTLAAFVGADAEDMALVPNAATERLEGARGSRASADGRGG
jgi:hypothetical protein